MPDTIPRHPVNSSNIEKMGHCPIRNMMTVEFKGGSKYVYHDVTLDLYTKVRDSESVGGAFHLHIKKPGVRNNRF